MKKVLTLCLLLLSLNVNAAWYQVEILIFENLYPQAGDEFWSSSAEFQSRVNSVELVPADANGNQPVAFKKLRPSRFKLGGIYNEMKSTRNYRPLLHLSWQQPGRSGSQATAVHLNDVLDTAGDRLAGQRVRLDGTVRLRVSRFLHMDVDLFYLLNDYGNSYQQPSGTGNLFTRVHESRKMKLNELHYFDHPLFGMITRVSRINVE